MLFQQNKGISSVVVMLIAAGVVVAGASFWLLFISNMEAQETEKVMEDKTSIVEQDERDVMMEGETAEKAGIGAMNNEDETKQPVNETGENPPTDQNDPPVEQTTTSFGVYVDYSAERLATAQAEGKKPVLFFWAAWCPFCKAANTEFNANLDKIPENVVLLKTNYDTETQLKTKYGITYQHTFVQVDTNGNQVTKWSGGGINELINNIN